jgi:hypothetical protein
MAGGLALEVAFLKVQSWILLRLLGCRAMSEMSKRSPGKRIFTYDEALATFPAVRDLTSAAVRQIEAVVNQVASRDEMEIRRGEIDEACQAILEAWTAEMTAMGCEVKGLWLVDWDSGDGYYCWRFPEEAIGFFHTYDDGFSGRIPIN